jgi:hypothetical protein
MNIPLDAVKFELLKASLNKQNINVPDDGTV